MSVTMTRHPSVEVLREEQRAITRQLAEAEKMWRGLSDDPRDFSRRTALAERIEVLRARAAELPTAIGAAETRGRARAILLQAIENVKKDAHAELCGLIDRVSLPRDEVQRMLTHFASVGALHGVLRDSGESLPPLFNPRAKLRDALVKTVGVLSMLQHDAVRPNLTPYAKEIAILTGPSPALPPVVEEETV